MRALFIGISILTNSTPLPAQETLGSVQLENLAERARSFVPKDEFDSQPLLPSVEGKRFSYVVKPLRRGINHMICSGFPSWGYWPQDNRIEFGAGERLIRRRDFKLNGNQVFPSKEKIGRDPDIVFDSLS